MSLLAVTTVDPAVSTLASLVTSLGSAGAAVAVVYYFLSFLRSERAALTADNAQRDERYRDVVKQLTDRLDDMTKRLDENTIVMRQFMQSASGICKAEALHSTSRRQSQ